MKKQVSPLFALLIIVVALAAVWFAYTRVFTGQTAGTIGPPSGVSLPPPPGGPESTPEMPRTRTPESDADAGSKAEEPGKAPEPKGP